MRPRFPAAHPLDDRYARREADAAQLAARRAAAALGIRPCPCCGAALDAGAPHRGDLSPDGECPMLWPPETRRALQTLCELGKDLVPTPTPHAFADLVRRGLAQLDAGEQCSVSVLTPTRAGWVAFSRLP